MQKIHIRQIFRVYIPFTNPNNYEVFQSESTDQFGFTLRDKNTARSLTFQLELFCLADTAGNTARNIADWASWAKRNPLYLANEPEGFILLLKINHGLFDFRKITEQLARVSLNHFVDGVLVQRGFSSVLEILPKKRQGAIDTAVMVPIQWSTNEAGINNTNINNTDQSLFFMDSGSIQPQDSKSLQFIDYSPHVVSHFSNSNAESSGTSNSKSSPDEQKSAYYSPEDEFESEGMHPTFSDSPSSFELAMATPQNDNYMVLYNGNAEVVGNFRALNFYKASDVSIKDDIRLLVEDYDCRATLLRIDGVEYKFKKGVRHDTNKRFVGYIAQQVESVVPQAVQLIDGILHVDYESLIPYLSESIRSNYNDIQDLKSNADQIHQLFDKIYEQFVDRDASKMPHSPLYSSKTRINQKRLSMMWGIIIGLIGATAIIAAIIGIVLLFHGDSPIDASPIDDNPDIPTLKEFYEATNGQFWFNNTGWLDKNSNPCYWFGVYCHDDMNIYMLHLHQNNLTGTIPNSITKLSNLTLLHLSNNSLHGTIPRNIGSFTLLQVLNLANNSLNGTFPKSLALAPLLMDLNLSYNRLGSAIPEELSENKNLLRLNLSHNNFRGFIPSLDNTVLHELDFGHNGFFGKMPPVPYMTKKLFLDHTELSGSLTFSFNSNIRELNIANTPFYGRLKIENDSSRLIQLLNISATDFTFLEIDEAIIDLIEVCDASNTSIYCPIPERFATKCKATCTPP